MLSVVGVVPCLLALFDVCVFDGCCLRFIGVVHCLVVRVVCLCCLMFVVCKCCRSLFRFGRLLLVVC